MSDVLIIIPTFNERDNVGLLIDGIMKLPVAVDVLVVDDNSPDNTAEVVQSKISGYGENRVKLIVRTGGKAGRGSAVLEGMKYAINSGYKTTIEIDADLSHNPNDIPRFIDELPNADVIVGSKHIRGGRIEGIKWHGKMLSRIANIYARLILMIPIHDYTNGFRCYGERALAIMPELRIDGKGFIVIPQMSYKLHKHGMTFKEIAIVFTNRRTGTSNMGPSEILESFFAILKIRSYSLYLHAKQIVKFSATGVLNAIVDLGCLAFLVEIMKMTLRSAVVLAGIIALTSSFLTKQALDVQKYE